MKHIKLYEELNFDRNVNVKWKSEDIPGGTVKYNFLFNGKKFCVTFVRTKRYKYLEDTKEEIILWERTYNVVGYDGDWVELGLKFNKLMDLIRIVTNITLDFLKRGDVDIVIIKHENMSTEEVPSTAINKRAKLNYEFLKKSNLSGFKLGYYSLGNEHFSDTTACYIFKPNEEENIQYLNKYNKRLI